MGSGVLSTIIRPTKLFSEFVVIFNSTKHNRLQFSARHYKMPAQQQADGVVGNQSTQPNNLQKLFSDPFVIVRNLMT
jgi:hypothetical protein